MDLTVLSQAMAAAGASTGNPNAWDISYAFYSAGDAAWDMSTASATAITQSLSAETTAPSGVFFKPDGTKMYVLDQGGDDVNEYNLSRAWDISSETFVQAFSVAGQETAPNDLFFKSDGTKMYVVGSTNDSVYEYDLSTAWDVNSASYVQSFSVATEDTIPTGLFFKTDGTKMYVLGYSGNDVNEYNLSTPWDISTASYSQNFSVSTQETQPQSLSFKDDGTKMYVVGSSGDDINEYGLSTPWDISSASYLQNFALVSQTVPVALFIRTDGSVFYVVSGTAVAMYLIGTFSVAAQDTDPSGLFFKSDGTKMYVLGASGDDVNEYDLSTAWNITTASYLQNFSIAAQEISPSGLFFKSDGTKMYVIGYTGDDVNEYNLSTPWDISTASFLQTKLISAQETTPEALFFKDDGTKMYVIGRTGDDVNEYNLSTAWDVSTASYVQAFSVAAQDGSPLGLSFKDDGTKMYVIGNINGFVYEYTLSSAWDVSTASYTTNAKIFGTTPQAMFFNPDGTQYFVLSSATAMIGPYSISAT
jgi:DNA-binding beta-propeller fold protein YncE